MSYAWYQFAKNQNIPDNHSFPVDLKGPRESLSVAAE